MAASDSGLDVALPANSFIRSLVSGQKWDGTQTNNITYAFTTDGPLWARTYEWTAAEKAATEKALAAFEAVCDIDFQLVKSSQSPNLEFRLVNKGPSSVPDAWGYAYFPDGSNEAGDTYFVRDTHRNWSGTIGVGGFGFQTIVHEIGHALGLDHPHEGTIFPGVSSSGDTGLNGLNQSLFTMMSYNHIGGSFQGVNWAPSTQQNYGFLAGPMAFDIAALQLMYGVNTTYRDGHTTYTLTGSNGAWRCLWDAGGTDAITYVGTRRAFIDLRAATLDRADPNAGGYLSRVEGIFGGFTIANKAVIENASGGSGNDQITGNSAINTLAGKGGDDTLAGLGGNDRLKPGVGQNSVDGGDGSDWIDFSDLTARVVVALADGVANGSVSGAATGSIQRIEHIDGSSAGDELVGNGESNTLDGNGGGDVLRAGGGNDEVRGGAGDDGILDDGGNDEMDGGADRDTVSYQHSADGVDVRLNGALWSDTRILSSGIVTDRIRNVENLTGSQHTDQIHGDAASNLLTGLGGNDTLNGRAGSDTIYGSGGSDTVDFSDKTIGVAVTLAADGSAKSYVGDGATKILEDSLFEIENLRGGSGADIFTGNGSQNTLEGGNGADTFFASGGNDRLDGDGHIDTVDFTSFTGKLEIKLRDTGETTASQAGVGIATLVEIENIQGGQGHDTLWGNSGSNVIRGGFGDDTFRGGGGFDVLDGQNGVNTLDLTNQTANAAVQLRDTSAGSLTVGSSGASLMSIQVVLGGSGNDTLRGNDAVNTLNGGTGDDILRGGDGLDHLNGEGGNDTLDYSTLTAAQSLSVTLNGSTAMAARVNGSQVDWVRGLESVVGGAGKDTIIGDDRDNRLDGRGGVDTLSGAGGADLLVALADGDVLDGGEGTAPGGVEWIDTADFGAVDAIIKVNLAGTGVAGVVQRWTGSSWVAAGTIRDVEKVIGGAFGDYLSGGNAHDELWGRSGFDILDGGDGNDVLRGGLGKDTLDGGTKTYGGYIGYYYATTSDTADYTDKTQAVVVALGFDTTLMRSTQVNVVVGGVVEDSLVDIENVTGGSGADHLTGNALANVLRGGGGQDTLRGGDGEDVLQGGTGKDHLDGGVTTYGEYNGSTKAASEDIADYSDRSEGIEVALAFQTEGTLKSLQSSVKVGGLVEDTLVNIVDVIGGSGSDSIKGDAVANEFYGGGGVDTLRGEGSDDLLDGGLGKDSLFGGAGKDTASYIHRGDRVEVVLGATTSTVKVDGAVEDVLSEIESVKGGGSNDLLGGNALDNDLFGNGGNDTFLGSGGTDYLSGGAGLDRVDFSSFSGPLRIRLQEFASEPGYEITGNVWLNPASISPQVVAHLAGIERAIGGSGGDTIDGSELVNRLEGRGGADRLNGYEGADTLTGGTGTDSFVFGGRKSIYTSATPLSALGVDTITDFELASDKIELRHETFLASGGSWSLTANNFGSGVSLSGRGADDVLFYETGTGRLYYDADGTGTASAAMHFATLENKAALAWAHITLA